MFIIIKTDEENEIINYLKTKNSKKTQYFLVNNTDEIQINNKLKRSKKQTTDSVNIVQPKTVVQTSSEVDCFITKNANSYEEYCNAIRKKILEPNRLSESEMKDIGYEQLDFLNRTNREKGLDIRERLFAGQWFFLNEEAAIFSNQYRELYYLIEESVEIDNNILKKSILSYKNLPPMFTDIVLPLSRNTYKYFTSGLLNRCFYPVMYYLDNFDIEIKDKKLKRFLDFYKTSLNILGLQYCKETNSIEINLVPKPSEIFMSDGITHCKYNNQYFCDGLNVPQWLYETPKEKLNPAQLKEIENVDVRTVFIKKIGIEKFIQQGKIIDSYENYPDNEWWVKSEYKLIDMNKILLKPFSRQKENLDYAPFLCMKNQTTGEYHLEGISPDCKDLYDALKMRYKGLNLPVYEIKDIK